MIRENTEFPLDAMKEESDRSPVLRGLGRFSARECGGKVVADAPSREREVCETLTVFPYPVSPSLPRRRFPGM